MYYSKLYALCVRTLVQYVILFSTVLDYKTDQCNEMKLKGKNKNLLGECPTAITKNRLYSSYNYTVPRELLVAEEIFSNLGMSLRVKARQIAVLG